MLNLKKFKKNLQLIFIMIPFYLFFQSCSKNSNQFTDQEVQKTMDFFEYRYNKATPIYFEIQIIPDIADASNKLYKLLGFATNSNASLTDIEYTIEIFDPGKNSVCTSKSGTLSAGQTLIDESCLLPLATTISSAIIKVRNPGGEWNVYTKNY